MSLRVAFLAQMTVAALVAVLISVPLSHAAKTGGGFAYVMTNQPAGNTVIQYQRASSGLLTETTTASTGGLGGIGNGAGALDPLGSQDSLVLSGDGTRLLAVDAGSNELSVLGVGSSGVKLLSKVASGGEFPNSVALYGNLVYALNAHGTPNVVGFRLDADGVLHPISGSTQALPGGTGSAPHDVVFSPDGTRLLVTEGGTNQIDIFAVGEDGLVTGVTTQASTGGPFGLRFGRDGFLAVTEASAGALATYELTDQNTLNLISPPITDGQMATCWLSITLNDHAFVSNTGSGNLSSYQVSADGSAALVKPVATSIAPGAPIDSAITSDGKFLYVEDSARGNVFFFQVRGNTLVVLGSVSGLPTTLQGIAAQ